jgi:DivIVA domain-containing protein
MGQLFLFIVVALVVAAIVFGMTVLVGGGDPGLTPVEPDGRALPLPSDRPLGEEDVALTRFDTAFRGYRMSQVDQALQRAAYDIGYKGELIGVLEAEVAALRDGRTSDADVLRQAREAAVAPVAEAPLVGETLIPMAPAPDAVPIGPPVGSTPQAGSLPPMGSTPPVGSLPPVGSTPPVGSLPPVGSTSPVGSTPPVGSLPSSLRAAPPVPDAPAVPPPPAVAGGKPTTDGEPVERR